MQLRRPIAALFTALALLGGGTASLTGCGDPATPNEGTTDGGNPESGDDPSSEDMGNLPDNSDRQTDSEDADDDSTDPD